MGQFTCITGNSCSVIDYVLTDTNIFSKIVDFEVKERLESIHLPICLTLSFSDNTVDESILNQPINQYTSCLCLKSMMNMFKVWYIN